MSCPPEHGPRHAHEMCGRCYLVAWRAQRRQPSRPRGHRALALATRAERLHAELVAAGDYSPVPATWGEVARQLGVKPTTLERARTRAKHYATAQ